MFPSLLAAMVGLLALTPSLPCSLPYGSLVVLIEPAPEGAVIPSGSVRVVLAASRQLPPTVSLVATDRRGTATPPALLERVPAPRRLLRIPFANPVYYRADGLVLPAHRHYTLALDDLAQNGCAPYASLAGNARFSTGA